MKHTFRHERAAECYAVGSADQSPLAPAFHTVRFAAPVQFAIDIEKLLRNPGAFLPVGTAAHHPRKIAVETHLENAAPQGFCQRTRGMKPVQRQNSARVGLKPEQLPETAVRHRENAAPVRIFDSFRSENERHAMTSFFENTRKYSGTNPVVRQTSGRFLRQCAVLILGVALWLRPAPASARQEPNTIAKQADGTYRVTGADYAAHIAANGILDSLQVGGGEFFSGPFLYGNQEWHGLQPVKWKLLKAELTAPDTLKTTLTAPDAEKDAPLVMFVYAAQPDGLHVTLNRLSDAWGGNVAWQVAQEVVAVEPLARPGFGYARLPGNGRLYALPTIKPYMAVRDMRYYLTNRRALDVTYLLGDSSYNRQNNGILTENRWGRTLVTKQPMEFVFAPVRTEIPAAKNTDTAKNANAAPRLRALPAAAVRRGIPFSVRPEAQESMMPVGKPAAFQMQFVPSTGVKGPLTLSYRLLDFRDKETAQGTLPIPASAVKSGTFRFTVTPVSTGWYRLTAALRAADTDTLPSEDEAEFGVFTPTPGLLGPPVSPNSSVGVTGVLGLQCIRDALVLTQYFPTKALSPIGNAKFDWKPMDDAILPFFAECAKYHVTGFCLLNVRPEWADPETFEKLVYQIVTRYKAQVPVWEIENEPQDRYTPENYVRQALRPAFQGAHAADNKAVVLGPSIVRVNLNWFAGFFKAGGGAVCDGVSTHTYIGHNRSWEEHGNAEDLKALRQMMKANGIGNKPIWQTEQGFTFSNHPDMPRLHAAYVVRMFALAASVGIPAAHCYYFYTSFNGFEPWYLYESAPNRAGMAARILGEQTAGMKFSREIALGKYAHGIVYTDGKTDTIVCWADDFSAPCRFQVPGAVAVRDIMGVSVAARPSAKGVLTVMLDGFPRYLRMPHGTKITPLDRFPAGTNFAASAQGSTAEASSYSGSEKDAANLNDGTWRFDDGQTDQKIWVGAVNAPMPQWASVEFDAPHRIDTLVAVMPSSNVGLAGPRHVQLQVLAGGQWRTMREWKNNTTEWVLYAHFPPVTTQAVRVLILDLNNGWWREDKTKFTDMAPRVYEIEAYGH